MNKTTRNAVTFLIMALLAALWISGCSDDKSTSSNPPPPPGNRVSITGSSFSPASLTISVGDTVTWTNNDAVAHTSTSNTGVWNSGTLTNGQSYSFVFGSTGSFPYHCTFHPTMTGTIIVQP